jgi:cytochrome c-type biogenesis protein CcmH
MRIAALSLLLALLAFAGCDRNIEPFDPDEKPREPDLSKIFPEGAEQAARIEPGLPPAPGGGRGAPPVAREVAAAEASEAAPILGRVEIAPELADNAPVGAILFIIGRRGGGGPPLAVKRVPDPVFPLDFTLGPDDRMIQAMPFTGPITLSARLDSDGNATSTEPGDLSGVAQSGPVDPGASGVLIRLDTAH